MQQKKKKFRGKIKSCRISFLTMFFHPLNRKFSFIHIERKEKLSLIIKIENVKEEKNFHSFAFLFIFFFRLFVLLFILIVYGRARNPLDKWTSQFTTGCIFPSSICLHLKTLSFW